MKTTINHPNETQNTRKDATERSAELELIIRSAIASEGDSTKLRCLWVIDNLSRGLAMEIREFAMAVSREITLKGIDFLPEDRRFYLT